MGVPVSELVTRAEAVVSALGHAPSTLWQYRWAWSQIELFCSQREADELTDEEEWGRVQPLGCAAPRLPHGQQHR